MCLSSLPDILLQRRNDARHLCTFMSSEVLLDRGVCQRAQVSVFSLETTSYSVEPIAHRALPAFESSWLFISRESLWSNANDKQHAEPVFPHLPTRASFR